MTQSEMELQFIVVEFWDGILARRAANNLYHDVATNCGTVYRYA